MFTAALFTIAKVWKQPKCPSVDEWIKQLWDIYTMEYYWAIKNKNILPFATTWIDLENIMLSEIRQRKKNLFILNIKMFTIWAMLSIFSIIKYCP